MILTNKKIEVKPILRNIGGMFPKGHDGEFMYTGTNWSTDLCKDKYTNRWKNILTQEEQKELEELLDMKPGDLSVQKKDSDFWSKFRVKLDKEGKTLDLSDPWDFLALKVLQASPHICPNPAETNMNGSYKFVLVDEDLVLEEKVTKSKMRQKAYKHFGKIEESVQDMQWLIRIVTGKRTNSTKLDFLQGEIEKLIENNLESFINAIDDTNYSTKVFLETCIDKNLVEKNHLGEYRLKGITDPFAGNLEEAITFMLSPKNNDIVLKLKANIKK
jgi:hypothetical protein